MRKINEIIIHCTGSNSDQTPKDIESYHIQHRGFKSCGYHYLIDNKGYIHLMRPLFDIGAHCKGHNKNSIGVAWIGGLDGKKDMNGYQKFALYCLLNFLMSCRGYNLCIDTVSTHHFYNPAKSCPNYKISELFPHFFDNHRCNSVTINVHE